MACSIWSRALGCAFAWDWYSLVFFRFIGGLGIGGSSVLGPMYIAEISPAQVARPAGGLLPVQRRFGNPAGLFVQLPDRPGGSATPNGAGSWASPASRGLFFFVMLFGIPHSPRWLVQKGRVRRRASAARYRRRERAKQELAEIVDSIDAEHGQRASRCSRASTGCRFCWRSIAMFNQFSGINAILYYLNDIFATPASTKSPAICRPSPSAPPTCCSQCSP